MKKLAIIGASYLQEPLITKAKSMELETHVFAWAANDVGEKLADVFYPISIVEKDEILAKCREIGIDGICTIASDLAAVTVNYVAHAMGLASNSPSAALKSSNKHEMRLAFERGGDPSPRSFLVETAEDLADKELAYPVIVKPLDRSGSRGITKLESPEGLAQAIEYAKSQGFDKHALVEEYAVGDEYSVECVSWRGEHHFLALTKKYTTGAPRFVETGHLQPAPVGDETLGRVKQVTFHALDSLGLEYGASHTEVKIAPDGTVRLIEIGGRMGGDCIGSDLVKLTTGVDYVRTVIDVALGLAPDLTPAPARGAAGVRFVFSEDDVQMLARLKREHPEYLLREDVREITGDTVSDSAARFGYYLFAADSAGELLPYLPKERE